MQQEIIDAICTIAATRFNEILDYLGYRYRQYDNGTIYSRCPVHGGDNPTAFRFYNNVDKNNGLPAGVWKCSSKKCHEQHGGGIIGFVQGITHRRINKYVRNEKVAEWLAKVLSIDIDKFDVGKLQDEAEKTRYINSVEKFTKEASLNGQKWAIEKITSSLEIPSPFFLGRGYSTQLLTQHHIGDSPRTNRAVIPVLDESQNFAVGFTARTKFPKCEKCKLYHDKNSACKNGEPKWRNNEGFTAGSYLYNYASIAIGNFPTVIVVESPGNALRLMDNEIDNVVAVFGSQMSQHQRFLLASANVKNLILIMDNDEAGQHGAEVMNKFCSSLFNTRIVDIAKYGSYNDVGDMMNLSNLLEDISYGYSQKI